MPFVSGGARLPTYFRPPQATWGRYNGLDRRHGGGGAAAMEPAVADREMFSQSFTPPRPPHCPPAGVAAVQKNPKFTAAAVRPSRIREQRRQPGAKRPSSRVFCANHVGHRLHSPVQMPHTPLEEPYAIREASYERFRSSNCPPMTFLTPEGGNRVPSG